ncbi:MAG: enoyl-CoA hydratase-related protein [Steroidobacteraceae bacterium]
MNYQKIQFEVREHIGILRLHDPTKLNALTPLMVDEINHVLDQSLNGIRALIVTGTGRAFCSGAALDGGMGIPDPDFSKRDIGLVLEERINPMMSRLRVLSIPWISVVRGAAAGAGASLGLAGDMVIASESAYFLQAFARIGLVPDAGSTHLLVRTIGRARAMELMMLADRLPAAKALEWGLINRVVPDAALDDEAFALASALAKGPTIALSLIRKAVWTAVDTDWNTTLQTERELQTTAGRTHDYDEGVAAFNAKRAAQFTGT